mmetsp:Transcript_34127/g.76189  ORF Transcript_34127/g.76189 Transcript_34127/m.76189 type:complete len:651 (-) Transcript_34127:9-1961(-)
MPRLFGGKKHHKHATEEEKGEGTPNGVERGDTPQRESSATPSMDRVGDAAEETTTPREHHHTPRGGLFGHKHKKRHERAAEAAQREAEAEEFRREADALREELDEVQERLEMVQSTSQHIENQFNDEKTKVDALQVAMHSFDEKSQELEVVRDASDTQRRVLVAQLSSELETHIAAARDGQAELQKAEAALATQKTEFQAAESKYACRKSVEALPRLRSELSAAQEAEQAAAAAELRSVVECSELQSELESAQLQAQSMLTEATTQLEETASARREATAWRKAASRLHRKLDTLTERQSMLGPRAAEALRQAATGPFERVRAESVLGHLEMRWQSKVQERDALVAELQAQLPEGTRVPEKFYIGDDPKELHEESDADSLDDTVGDTSSIEVELEAAQAACVSLRAEVDEAQRSKADAAARQALHLEEQAEHREAEALALATFSEKLREIEASSAAVQSAGTQALAELGQERVSRAVAVSEALAETSAVHAASMQHVDSSRKELLGELQQVQRELATDHADCTKRLRDEICSQSASCAETLEEVREVNRKRLEEASLDSASQKLEHQLSEEVERSRRFGEQTLHAEESRRRLLHELAESVQVEADITAVASLMGRAARSVAVITREARKCAIPAAAPTPARSSSLLVEPLV